MKNGLFDTFLCGERKGYKSFALFYDSREQLSASGLFVDYLQSDTNSSAFRFL
jgi:hypothetical protein